VKPFALILLCACALPALGHTVTLAWDAPASYSTLQYYVFAGTNSGFAPTNYTMRVDAGTNLSCTISNLTPAVWTFAATARDTNGLESDFSQTVSAEVLAAPKNMRLVVLEYLDTLLSTNWQRMGLFRMKAQ
jgi:hypothetical protein